ncbi:MAG: hypothetical protein LBF67_08965 [Prevotellaceae bacterium]|nr:hypothetical protein [Prevotellaceae bacterium]
MKALLLNFTNEKEEFVHCLQRLGCEITYSAAQRSDVNMALVHTLRSLTEVGPYIHSLCHLFVLRHTLLPEELRQLEKLVNEADVKVQFASSKLYEWRIVDILQQLGEVKFMQAYSDFEGDTPLTAACLRTEAQAATVAARAALRKVEKLRAMIPGSANVLGVRADFVNTASAYFWLSSAAFAERHELRFFGDKGFAAVNVLTREANIKMLDGEIRSMPFLSEAESREAELQSFIADLHSEKQPFFSSAEAITQQEIMQQSQLK